VTVDPAVLYVDHGALLTSAGAAAGLDLCLHMVRADLGADAAAAVARATVMPLERSGGQAQFTTHPAPALSSGDSLAPLLEWLHHHLDEPLTTSVLARQAAGSERSLRRRFREQTGVPPTRWHQVARVRRAQRPLETSDLGVEQVAGQVGLGSPSAFRDTCRVAGTSPHAYRLAFRGSGDRDPGARTPGQAVVDRAGWSHRQP
jgi:transcriptional regulator GlxA family with amidase domain